MSKIKLKPCPFCGGKGVLNNEKDRIFSFVKCIGCGAESGVVRVSAEYCADERAAEAWNKRISIDNIALKLEYEGDGYDDEGELVYDTAYCPICHHEYEVDHDDHDNYCRNCGQKLDWSRVENETD